MFLAASSPGFRSLRVLGMDRVMVVCEAGNSASAKTIERQGGILEVGRDSENGAARRYWIRISDQ